MYSTIFSRIAELNKAEATLQKLKDYCNTEIDLAQNTIEKEGYTYEQSHRTDVLEEILKFIEKTEKTT